jgi:uncharacterized protein
MNKGAIIGLCLVLGIFLGLGAVSADPAQAKKKFYRVEARTTTFGGSSYILGFAACDLLNKYSDSVRGSVLESTGTPENIKLVGLSAKKRKRTFFTITAEMFEKARKGLPPYAKNADKFKDLMVMAYQQSLAGVIITLDPKIKTLADLKGKRVATWPKGTTKFDLTYTLVAGAGKDVVDSVKWQFTGYAGYNDMILGKVDAAFSFLPERGPRVYTTVPKLKELMSKRQVYFVTATGDMRKASAKLFGAAYGATATVPVGALGKGIPRQKIMGWNILLGWGVYPEMPEKVVYEILKVMDAHGGLMKTYHSAGKNWTADHYGAFPATKDQWHPGARKFYEEKKIPYGDKYFLKVYPME